MASQFVGVDMIMMAGSILCCFVWFFIGIGVASRGRIGFWCEEKLIRFSIHVRGWDSVLSTCASSVDISRGQELSPC